MTHQVLITERREAIGALQSGGDSDAIGEKLQDNLAVLRLTWLFGDEDPLNPMPNAMDADLERNQHQRRGTR